jgi:hypothetical protein
MPSDARSRSARLPRETTAVLCAILLSSGRPTWGQLAQQPATQDAALIAENGTPIYGMTFGNWVNTALNKAGSPNAASVAFYFHKSEVRPAYSPRMRTRMTPRRSMPRPTPPGATADRDGSEANTH